MIQRRTPLRRGAPPRRKRPGPPRRKAARCDTLRCTRAPYRKDVTKCGTHLIALIDAEARRRVFERDRDKCRRCGSTENLQWSHWPSRSYRGTRWSLAGSCVHCAACHRYFTDRPLEHEAWMVATFGQDEVTEIRQMALEVASGRAKVDLVETARNFGVIK